MNGFLNKVLLLLIAALIGAYFIFAETINSFLLMAGQRALAVGSIIVAFLLLLKLKGNLPALGGDKTTVSKLKGGNKSSGAHGSADFATLQQINQEKLMGKTGFILGRHQNGQFIRFNRAGHLITFAPTRSGKGIGHVIPNLLDHPGSVIVNDIKGENFAVSGEYRKKFSDVYTFAPFGETSSCYNPLDFIRLGTEYELDDVSLIAEMVVIVNENAKDPFWDRESQNLVKCLILHVASSAPPALRNMVEVRYLLMQNKKDFEYSIKEMCKSKNGHVKKMASAISATEPKVMASLLSVARSQTAVWDSPKLQKITSRSDFDPTDFKKKPTSFYLIIPPESLETYKSVVRLMTGIMLAAMLRTKGKPEHPVLFLIDEFPALGYMQNIETGVGYLAGYGVSVWMFIQDLAQLKANYPKWESLIANCSARIAFGTNDFDTAKVLSDMLGTTTITVTSSGQSKEGNKMLFRQETGISSNTSETGRQLMTPDEVMRIPFEQMLVFVQGVQPILAKKVMYFKDQEFKGKFGKWEG